MIRHELIGSIIRVINSKNTDLENVEGKVIDETKNIVVIDTKKGIKKIIKNQVKMEINLKGKKVEIDGKELVGRPEERIKK
ncbi:ribonuclease P protein subunit [Candidatus Woesearchaeota archaeon]|nr:ribonuclease P protein subunit [Candidatus Woesearchaeota archaeon]